MTAGVPHSRWRRLWRFALVGWILAAIASNLWWRTHPFEPLLGPEDHVVELPAVRGTRLGEDTVQLAFRDLGSRDDDATTLVLLHGSPGTLQDFDKLAKHIAGDFRVLVPDLPGFGRSQRKIPDYSARAHSIYLEGLLDELSIESAHLVAFSMGGAVAAEFGDRCPARTSSISMIAALGVEELELFGNHDLNHLIHGVQLAFLDGMALLIPHFGGADRWVLGHAYARNFNDTDQSRIRGCLERWDGPLQVIHGEHDFLVPIEAAREHARIVPQSDLLELDASHFVLWTRTAEVAELVEGFVRRVEAGKARTRAAAQPERVARAREAFDPSRIPPASGPTLLVLMFLFVVGTWISEDLTSIAAGLMVAQGRIEFFPAVFACCVGVYVGDMGLFLLGRWLGRPVVERRPVSWFLSPAALERASLWLQERGVKTIFLSRLMPGLRLPTYFAAGVLKTRFVTFAFYFLLAVVIWTPILVGFAAWVGAEALVLFEEWGAVALIGILVALLVLERVVLRLFTFRGRRSLVGTWKRWTLWEFWPPWLFYPPVALYILWLAVRHRSLALVTAVNPAIPTGGFIGESKSAILTGLNDSSGRVACFRVVSIETNLEDRCSQALDFLSTLAKPYPVVLKPDVGQRGSGVRILKNEAELLAALDDIEVDHILQEFVAGPEYGVFYLRHPKDERGRIFSITEKVFPELRGDGVQTLEELILRDPRAVAIAQTYFEMHADELDRVPTSDETIRLVELGTHCRGAIFKDGNHLLTPELERCFDELSRGYDGFYFGRYDLRANCEEDFRRGASLRVIELNGVTAEAAHIYDARTPLFEAWRVLCEQWRLAFEIAATNRDRGARPASVGDVWREWLAYRARSGSHRN